MTTPPKMARVSPSNIFSTASTELFPGNNTPAAVGVDVYLSVPVDIAPGSTTNPVTIGRRGLVTVAIISGGGFDATTLNVATACFGDAEDASQRTREEVHGVAHKEDADKDKDKDLDIVFHFQVLATGIDLGDTTACLKGTTTNGIGFYGCDMVTPVP